MKAEGAVRETQGAKIKLLRGFMTSQGVVVGGCSVVVLEQIQFHIGLSTADYRIITADDCCPVYGFHGMQSR